MNPNFVIVLIVFLINPLFFSVFRLLTGRLYGSLGDLSFGGVELNEFIKWRS